MGSFQEFVEHQKVTIEKHPNCTGLIGIIEILNKLTKQPEAIRCETCERLGMTIYQKPLTQK